MADLILSGHGPTDWHSRLEDLALVASAAPETDQRSCIEALRKLLLAAPARALAVGYRDPDPRKLFALLDLEAWETAIMLLVPPSAGFMASRGGYDRYIVSIMLPGCEEESTSAGSTLALAVVSTFALAISESGNAFPRPGPNVSSNHESHGAGRSGVKPA